MDARIKKLLKNNLQMSAVLSLSDSWCGCGQHLVVPMVDGQHAMAARDIFRGEFCPFSQWTATAQGCIAMSSRVGRANLGSEFRSFLVGASPFCGQPGKDKP